MGSSEKQSFLGARWRRWRGCWAELPAKRRETMGAAVVLGLLIAIAFLPLFAGRNFLPFARYPNWGWADARNNGVPLKVDEAFFARKQVIPWVSDMDFGHLSGFFSGDYFTAQSLRKGILPLWDPYSGCGYPTFDSGQYRPFNPLRWLFYLFPTYWTYCLTLLLGLPLGALGAFLWLRREGFASPLATLGAALFVVNPWVLDRLTILDPFAFFLLPWALLGLHQARWGNLKSVALAALPFVIMGNVGEPEPCLVATFVASAHFLVLGDSEGGGRRGWLRRIGVLGEVGLLSALALSIHWAPLIRLYGYGFSYKKLAVSVVVPYSWQGLFTLASDLFIAPTVVGLVGAALIVRRGRTVFWMLALALVLFLIMPLPWVGYTVQRLLQAHLFAVPLVYFKGLLWTCIAFLAPAGLDALLAGHREARWICTSAGILAFACDALLIAVLPLPISQQSRFPALAMVMLGSGLVALFFAMLRKPGALGILLLGLLVALPSAFPLSLNHLDWNTMSFQRGGLMAWIRRQHPHDRTVSPVSRGFVIPPNEGSAYGIRCADLNAVFFLGQYFQLFFTPPAPPTLIAFRTPATLLLRQTGASLLLAPEGENVGLGPPEAVASGSSAYSLPGAEGRLFFAYKTAPFVPSRPIGEQLWNLGKGNDGVAVVETMGQPAPSRWPEGPVAGGRLTFVRDEAERVTIAAEAPREALLVLRDSWYPGWRASVDGRRVPIYRVNGCFRGVLVPAGRHEVRFVYRPWHVYIPAAVSLLTTLLLIGGAWSGLRRRPPPVQGAAGG